ncbi:MAG: hypothetical protein IPK97_20350 [Ahniella sp.]|nr:hypothetical protein [Ahniella sp.]
MNSMLRKLMLVLFTVVAVSGCAKEEEKPKKQPVQVVVPTDANDLPGWKKYLTGVVQNNMGGVRSRPFVYFVPAGDDDATKEEAQRQLESVQDVVLRGVLPGNMLAFGGPDAAKVAVLINEGFKDVRPNSLKGVKVLVVGNAADEQAMRDTLAPGGADFIFVALP